MLKQLIEKYRPKTIDGYVFKDEFLKNKIISYITKANEHDGSIPFPNLLFGGRAGTGKTTLAYILCNECNVLKSDIMYINASRENNIETVRNKINAFCSTMSVGDFKVIILDEFDRMSLAGQDALKSMFEIYSSTVRFIATANSPEKIIEPLHSRFQVFNFQSVDYDTFLDRLAEILTKENITFDLDNLEKIINKSFPDLRKAINLIDQFTVNGVLTEFVSEDIEINENLFSDILTNGKNKKYLKVRELSSQFRSDELEQFLLWAFRNIEIIVDDPEIYGDAFVIIKEGLKNLKDVADVEIHISSIVAELSRLNG